MTPCSALIGCRLRGGAAGAAAGAGHGLPPPHRQVHQAGQGDADTRLDTRMEKDFELEMDGYLDSRYLPKILFVSYLYTFKLVLLSFFFYVNSFHLE